jgi:hypothetical protein
LLLLLRLSSIAAPTMTATASSAARKPSLTTKAKVSTAAPPSTTIDSGFMPERPRPSSASIGDAESFSAGMSSQPSR